MIKVIMLWLVDQRGEVLLARRADHKDNDPGLWGPSVTGRLDPGEAIDVALKRETEEELGLKTEEYRPEYLDQVFFDHPDGRRRRFDVYFAHIGRDISQTLRLDPDEVAGVKWQPMSSVMLKLGNDPSPFVPSAPELWPEIFKQIENVIQGQTRSRYS